MSNFFHPLMHDNFEESDFKSLIKFLKKKPILTQYKKVEKFEEAWSKWLGTKYSVFVNSGSSANFLSVAALYAMKGNDKRNEIIVPSLTWISDIVSVIKNDFKPVFVDVNFDNLSMNVEQVKNKITRNTLGIFLTHAQGFNGLNNELLEIVKKKNLFLIEDVCESHGAIFKNKKLGNFGIISNFSFYYAHHMSTIEGGMVCTNNKKIYEIVRMLRAHGMLREVNNKSFEDKMKKKYSYLSPKFIFMHPGFNMRSNEISAVIGLNQLKRLDKNNLKRKENFKFFLKNLNIEKFITKFKLKGSCNYAFPLILKDNSFLLRDKLESLMKKSGIEFRRGNAGGGNQIRQPYLEKITKNINLKNFPVVEHIHNFGYYIGNYPSLKRSKILKICKILNNL